MKKDNIHDKYIKSILGEIKTAKSFLENYLPKEIIPLIDLNYLKPIKDSFVDTKLKEHFTDLIYKTKTKDNKEVYIYTLFEHKSYYDKFSVIQLLKYIGLCYDKYKSNNMPIVIPLLLYNGEEEWKSAKDLSHLFKGVNLEFMKYIPNFNFEFYDFVREDRIIGNDELRMMINSFKYRLNPKRKDLFKTINFLYLNKHTINIFLRYIIITISEEYQEMVIKMLKEKIKEDDIMSIADALRREGIQIGEEKGLERGKEEERLNLVKKMLLKGLDVATISELTNLSIDRINEIKISLTK